MHWHLATTQANDYQPSTSFFLRRDAQASCQSPGSVAPSSCPKWGLCCSASQMGTARQQCCDTPWIRGGTSNALCERSSVGGGHKGSRSPLSRCPPCPRDHRWCKSWSPCQGPSSHAKSVGHDLGRSCYFGRVL